MGSWNGPPIGLFLFSAMGLPYLRSSGGGHKRQSLTGLSVLRDGFLVPVRDSSLTLLCSPVVTTLRVCLPRAPALRQVLEAVLAEGALESPSILVLAFHSSLSFVEGSSDGLAASVCSLSPGRFCLTHSVRVEFSRLCAISLLGLAFLAPLGLTVVFCRIQWRRSARKLLRFPCGWGLSVLSLDRVLLTSSLSSSGRSLPGLSWLPLMGFDFAGLVVWLLMALRSLTPPSRSIPCARFVTFWRLCDASWSPPFFPHPLRHFLASA